MWHRHLADGPSRTGGSWAGSPCHVSSRLTETTSQSIIVLYAACAHRSGPPFKKAESHCRNETLRPRRRVGFTRARETCADGRLQDRNRSRKKPQLLLV